MNEQIEIFCCYAHKDQSYLLDLKKHLAPLLRLQLINNIWYDADIRPGMDWEHEIHKHLNTAQVILLLISPDFMASDYCYGKEMARAIERHDRGEATVIPVIVRPVFYDLAEIPFGKLKALPTDAKPITSWPNSDEAFFTVAQGIHRAIKERVSPLPPLPHGGAEAPLLHFASKEQWFDEGWVNFHAERYNEALAAFEQALQLDSNFTDAHSSRGDTLYRLKRYEEALSAYEQAIQLDSHHVWAWYGKGDVLRNRRHYDEALKAYERVTELEPGNVWAWREKGDTLRHLKQYEEAIAAYQHALELNPRLSRAYCGRGDALCDLGYYEEALQAYEQALQLGDTSAWPWWGKGNALQKLGKFQEAQQAHEQAKRLER